MKTFFERGVHHIDPRRDKKSSQILAFVFLFFVAGCSVLTTGTERRLDEIPVELRGQWISEIDIDRGNTFSREVQIPTGNQIIIGGTKYTPVRVQELKSHRFSEKPSHVLVWLDKKQDSMRLRMFKFYYHTARLELGEWRNTGHSAVEPFFQADVGPLYSKALK